MNEKSSEWTHYRSFLAVVQEGSLSAAARRLNLTQPTLGRHIDALEQQLGRALFARGRNGLEPTEVALALIPHVEAMNAAAEALLREASGESSEPSGTIRVTASEVVGCEILPSVLVPFRQRYPTIALELSTSDRVTNLLMREADIAIRMTEPNQTALVARHIGQVEVALYAHRDYLARRGTPQHKDDVNGHALIGFDRDDTAVRVLREHDFKLERADFDLRTDNNSAQLAAIRCGLGIGPMQCKLAEREPNLVRILSDSVRFELPMWLAMHESLRSVRRVRLLFDHLGESLRDWVAD
ncbi:LysR family transcriptional regulator [Saccharospirillum sp. MSK14-1]|uniref:LysR family transcriptional regulator n=1 Tax=Saccharospirillum sp. MSK14-1 TaxID=1897632 RepID=UPI000D3D7937|nr:LysR family transcriptional regulator [Saccharospirillum sp. MSK14-1]PTY37395.1 LysR family transcriptional regulator [Saccharospirillum sp. MSK14-1]